ncbi:TM2 domain-containing protein [Melghirimyces algeriensis]|uniref:TM2 domain-containing protein n=1 Tax=Melghirimyces algeriensis TaxID=910412 RepID=A0A521E193_9BACL|nr:TM2 domain-containing protein [Melghirimyces algeriensis]SMO77605.1 TM2 domain-containing protein [Melghirimyces algeriensis]
MAESKNFHTPERNHRERLITAYGLWLFLGVFGAHRFYLGRIQTGLLMALVGPFFLAFGLFFYLLPGLNISPLLVISPFLLWLISDAIRLPKWLAEQK